MTKPRVRETNLTKIEIKNQHEADFLHFSHLSKSYLEGGKRRIVLKDASLAIGRGEFLAILGRSGSGKTTY